MTAVKYLPKWRKFRVLNFSTGEYVEVEAVCYEQAVLIAAQNAGQGECDLHVGQYTYSIGDFAILKQ